MCSTQVCTVCTSVQYSSKLLTADGSTVQYSEYERDRFAVCSLMYHHPRLCGLLPCSDHQPVASNGFTAVVDWIQVTSPGGSNNSSAVVQYSTVHWRKFGRVTSKCFVPMMTEWKPAHQESHPFRARPKAGYRSLFSEIPQTCQRWEGLFWLECKYCIEIIDLVASIALDVPHQTSSPSSRLVFSHSCLRSSATSSSDFHWSSASHR